MRSVLRRAYSFFFFFFQAEDGIRDYKVTGVQTCALPICPARQVLRLGEELERVLRGNVDLDALGIVAHDPAPSGGLLVPPEISTPAASRCDQTSRITPWPRPAARAGAGGSAPRAR